MGFRLKNLTKLSDTKSADNKTTLLHAIATEVMRSNETMILDEMGGLMDPGLKVGHGEANDLISMAENQVNGIRSFLASTQAQHPDDEPSTITKEEEGGSGTEPSSSGVGVGVGVDEGGKDADRFRGVMEKELVVLEAKLQEAKVRTKLDSVDSSPPSLFLSSLSLSIHASDSPLRPSCARPPSDPLVLSRGRHTGGAARGEVRVRKTPLVLWRKPQLHPL